MRIYNSDIKKGGSKPSHKQTKTNFTFKIKTMKFETKV